MQLNHIVKSLLITGLFTTSSLPLLAAEAPKDATAATQQANNLLYNQLPFADNTDFTDAHKGFIAPIPQDVIKGETKGMLSGIHNITLLSKKAIKPLIR